MHVVPNLAQRLAMVGGEHNDAVVVKLPLLEIGDESPKAAIQPLDLGSVSRREGRIVAARRAQLVMPANGHPVHVLRLAKEKNRPAVVGAGIELALQLRRGVAKIEVAPVAESVIQLHHRGLRQQQHAQHSVYTHVVLVAIGVDHLFQAVERIKRLNIMLVQQHGPGPDGRLRQRSAAVAGESMAHDHALLSKFAQVGREVYARVVSGDVILAKAIGHDDKNVGQRAGRGLELRRQLEFHRRHHHRSRNVRLLLQEFAQVVAWDVMRDGKKLANHLERGVKVGITRLRLREVELRLAQQPRPINLRGDPDPINREAAGRHRDEQRSGISSGWALAAAIKQQCAGDKSPGSKRPQLFEEAIPIHYPNERWHGVNRGDEHHQQQRALARPQLALRFRLLFGLPQPALPQC